MSIEIHTCKNPPTVLYPVHSLNSWETLYMTLYLGCSDISPNDPQRQVGRESKITGEERLELISICQVTGQRDQVTLATREVG